MSGHTTSTVKHPFGFGCGICPTLNLYCPNGYSKDECGCTECNPQPHIGATKKELEELSLLDKLRDHVKAIHFTKTQAESIEAKADAADALAHTKINASHMSEWQKSLALKAADFADAKTHSFVDAHTDAEMMELRRLLLTKRDRFEDTNQHEKEMACIAATGHSQC